MADIFKYRPEMTEDGQNELYSSVRQLVLHAWSFRESEARRLGLAPPPAPPLIAQLREMCRAPQQAASLPPAAAPAHQHGNYQAKGSTSPAGIAAASHDDASALAPRDHGPGRVQLPAERRANWRLGRGELGVLGLLGRDAPGPGRPAVAPRETPRPVDRYLGRYLPTE